MNEAIEKAKSQGLTNYDLTEVDLSDRTLAEISGNSHTLLNLRAVGEKFNTFLWKNGLTLNAETVAKFKKSILESGLKSSTANVQISDLRRVIKAQEIMRNNRLALQIIDGMFKNLTKGRVNRKVNESEYLTRAELAKLLKVSGEKDSLLIRFLANTGLRVTEALNVKISDLRNYNKIDYIFTVIGKGENERDLTVKKELANQVIKEYNSEVFLFETKNNTQLQRNSVYRTLRNLAIKAKINKTVGVHTFRHTFATLALQSGKSLKWVSQALGHSSTAITADMYIHENHTKDMSSVIGI